MAAVSEQGDGSLGGGVADGGEVLGGHGVADGHLGAGAGVELLQDLGMAPQLASVHLVQRVGGEEFEYGGVPAAVVMMVEGRVEPGRVSRTLKEASM
ncbi:hypothetical protein OG819_29460 [Streptomyces sp. NBC_01549]|uniref:hypothetical protein n=1 Tax=Streptomyces sp. NBC_01549 TaxID=2975874 RepID=UPI002257A82D|nr:hypothetical protein [Streptomyces sp. NBC_01549]MCX4593732.1 hypothetical protein [Streptomyces sp. NBC_01549]